MIDELPPCLGLGFDKWHVTRATYADAMDTYCGQRGMRATEFTTRLMPAPIVCGLCMHNYVQASKS